MSQTTIVEHDYLHIDGGHVPAASGRSVDVVSAATEEVIGRVPETTQPDVDRAVAAARTALTNSDWSRFTPAERAATLSRFADALEARGDELARTVTAQNGMPINLSEQFEAQFAVGILRYYAALAETFEREERRPSPLGFDTLVRKDPIGVVGAIVPWNFPVVLAVSKLGPALATGCTVVVKPSPGTVLDSYIVADAALEAGIPAGVINWVHGDRDLGAYLVAHPGVDKVAFTGSTAAGRQIGQVCGSLVRPVSLELGGKSAAILLDDVNLEQAMEQMLFTAFANNGQACCISTRILAPKSRYREIVDAFGTFASELVVGDPFDRQTQIGPLASAAHRDRVEGYIAIGRESGARLVCGGSRPKGQDRGWFVEPTIFADVDNSSTIAQEEVFGPVLAILPYDNDEDAIRMANDSDYGLGGSVFSSDRERALGVARQVHTGTIGIDGYVIDFNSPFGGVKASGIGRELGPEGLSAYIQSKAIFLL